MAESEKVAIARITAQQAVMIALITTVLGGIVTQVGQVALKAINPPPSGVSRAADARPSGPDAPYVTYAWEHSTTGLLPCKSRAEDTLRTYGATNIDTTQSYLVWAGSGGYTLMISCLVDYGIVAFSAAGPDGVVTDRTVADLRMSFKGAG